MKIVNGKIISQKIKGAVKREIERLGLSLSLYIVLVGEDKISKVFLSQKEKACQEVGINFYCHQFSENVMAEEITTLVHRLNSDSKVTGILIQFPLPSRLGSDPNLLDKIDPPKDVDCLTSVNFGKFASGNPFFIPPTAQAVNRILNVEKIKIKGLNAVVVGAGRIAGLPIALFLLNQGATVTICHEFTKDLSLHTKRADILISATGQPHLIKGSMVKTGAIVIDVGTSFVKGKITGDVDINSLEGIASKITPIPGGVGPVTVACLLRNIVSAAKL